MGEFGPETVRVSRLLLEDASTRDLFRLKVGHLDETFKGQGPKREIKKYGHRIETLGDEESS